MSSSSQIILLGSKGSGKTAFIATLCGLSILFSTRYAFEWHLSPSGPWTANIYICRRQPTTLWDVKVAFCTIISTPLDLQNAIRRTQIAVFKPKASFEEALATDEASLCHFETQLTSRQSYCAMSTVHVYLQCPGFILSPMVFVDLPKHSDQLITHTVNDLVLHYIRPQHNIILATVPIAMPKPCKYLCGLLNVEDPQRIRTLVVLTGTRFTGYIKPWLEVLQRIRARPCLHFAIHERDPSDSLAGSTNALDFRQLEMAFFATTAPWSAMQEQQFLGVSKVARALVKLSLEIHAVNQLTPIDFPGAYISSGENEISVGAIVVGIFLLFFLSTQL